MKTLVVSTHDPFPATTGGAMRTMHFVDVLGELGPVDLAYVRPAERTAPSPSPFRHTLRLTIRDEGRVAGRVVRGLVARRPFPIHDYDRASRRALVRLAVAEDYDCILVRSAHVTGLVLDLPARLRARVLLDLDDDITGTLYDQLVGVGSGVQQRIFDLNRKVLDRHLTRCVRQVVCLVCTEDDATRLRPHAKHLALVPNVYEPDASARALVDGYERGDSILFVGTLNYPPNVEGLTWFVGSILPSFLATHPGAKLLVVGRNPTPEVRSLCAHTDAVELHADVDDILAFYDTCRAVVVPLRSGGGTRIKILEACFAGRPVISTAIGAEGLDLRDGEELLLFETADAFASAYDRLRDRALYHRLVAQGHDAVATGYSKRRVAEVVHGVLSKLDRPGAAPGPTP